MYGIFFNFAHSEQLSITNYCKTIDYKKQTNENKLNNIKNIFNTNQLQHNYSFLIKLVGGLMLLLIVFITLKLTNIIAWSWLWIIAPLWIPIALYLFLLLVLLLI